jgi:phenylacetate-coenzyme A ligase PaaK-like adenylate-forming protein
LEQWQFARLREQLAYARDHSPYYAQRLAGIDIAAILARADLALLPFTPAQALREQPQQLLCLSGGQAARVATLNTSGSSGDSKRVWFSAKDLARTVEFFACGMTALVEAGQTALILLSGHTPDSLGDLLRRALTDIKVRPLLHGPLKELPAAEAEAAQAHCLIGLPVQINRLCLSAPRLRPKTVLLSADYVPQGIVDNIRRLWGSAVFTHYGMTENGFGLAVQCGAFEGHHLRDAEFMVEIIDPASGQPLPDGCWGEVTLTSLSNEAMPLIRYRSGDIARRIVAPCACGGNLPRLDKVQGRAEHIQREYSIHTLDEALFALPYLLDYQAQLLPAQGLRLILDSLSPYGEAAIRQALRRQNLAPPLLEIWHKNLPLFNGPAKRKVFLTEDLLRAY